MRVLVDSDQYYEFVREKRFAVIYFDARWNGTGIPLRPRFADAQSRFAERVNFGEVDCDHWDSFTNVDEPRIVTVPTVAYYRDGALEKAYAGASQDVVAQTKALIAGENIEYITARFRFFK